MLDKKTAETSLEMVILLLPIIEVAGEQDGVEEEEMEGVEEPQQTLQQLQIQ